MPTATQHGFFIRELNTIAPYVSKPKHKPEDDLFHLLNLICLKYTGQYLPADCEPVNHWKYIVVDGKRVGVMSKLNPRSVMDACVFNPLALQIKRQMINDEFKRSILNDKPKLNEWNEKAPLTNYKIDYEERNSGISYGVSIPNQCSNVLCKLFKDDQLTPERLKLLTEVKDEAIDVDGDYASGQTEVAKSMRRCREAQYTPNPLHTEQQWITGSKFDVWEQNNRWVMDIATDEQRQCWTKSDRPYKNKSKFKSTMEAMLWNGYCKHLSVWDRMNVKNTQHGNSRNRSRYWNVWRETNPRWAELIWNQLKAETPLGTDEIMSMFGIRKTDIEGKLVSMYC